MINLRPILFVLGLLISILALAMLLPTLVGLSQGRDGLVFLGSAGLVLFTGVLMVLITRGKIEGLEQREAFLITVAAWAILPVFAALPFRFTENQFTYTDALFEAMSGLTTTGSTMIADLEVQSRAILLWRSILQWLGGVGIVLMALSVLPLLKVGGMQLFRIEFAGRGDQAMPRAIQLVAMIFLVYILMTTSCMVLYWLAGMSAFDALNHAMTTVATGGFATRNESIGFYASPIIESIAILFMLLGSLPFLLYIQAIRGGGATVIGRDEQVRGLLMLVLSAIAVLTWYLIAVHDQPFWLALRRTTFNVTSILTGTGYATANYDLWGVFAIIVFLFVMFIGGCAGSTTCGIKIFRIQVLLSVAGAQIRHLLQPHAVVINLYAGKPLPAGVGESVMGFFFLFILTFAASSCLLGLAGLDFITAVSGAATAIANVGPGLGPIIGPNGNFSSLNDPAKWILVLTMLLGRLELFTVFVLFSRRFWVR
ncbi:MAG: TrkH family potassium uptake protein [Pseudomonadota bacterium]